MARTNKGRAVASGGIHEIRALMSSHPHNIVIEGRGMTDLAKVLISRPYTVSVELKEGRKGLIVRGVGPGGVLRFGDRSGQGVGLRNLDTMQSLDDDLESIFKYLVG